MSQELINDLPILAAIHDMSGRLASARARNSLKAAMKAVLDDVGKDLSTGVELHFDD